ncbi:MAG: prepilin-type N-terminal cleavage/methylation domain-containing protein [Gallionellales bacterium RIFCSPLOWO2_02_FULL_57_47]|nr:MAG: prepilin-type N-terminal cleavage/methylation domain-containing protein [Gallionellales bacterium RIFCSPLOWO2_02_FULL_57_47]
MKRNQSGFTLIEIAIVLVIIGLLIGGVLKGQELINSAKVKNLATDFKNIPVFIYGYQDKFKALPGDDKDPATHVGSPVTNVTPTGGQTLGNGIIEGPWLPTALTDETLLFWQHIRVAGLAPGPTTLALTGFLPTNASGGNVGVQSGSNSPITGLRGTYIICSEGILGKFVTQLDTTMDDGKPNSGSMMTLSLSAAPAAATTIDETLTYTVCMGV